MTFSTVKIIFRHLLWSWQRKLVKMSWIRKLDQWPRIGINNICVQCKLMINSCRENFMNCFNPGRHYILMSFILILPHHHQSSSDHKTSSHLSDTSHIWSVVHYDKRTVNFIICSSFNSILSFSNQLYPSIITHIYTVCAKSKR